MTAGGQNERFFAHTRGQVVALLRHGDRTVEELAQALGLTDNAVRAHLVTWSEMASCDRPHCGVERANQRTPTR
jgi:DNA-binding transcriptional ArsR family regulator